VTRQVVAGLRGQPGARDPALLDALLDPANPWRARLAGYRLSTRGGDAWRRLAVDLRLIEDPDERLRRACRADIASWLDRIAATVHHPPTRGQAAELDALIAGAGPVLGEHRVRLLRLRAGRDCGPPAP
jgi:hypothetical protein